MIEELVILTKPFNHLFDQIQGAGGNTSVKNSDGKMAIKASGFRFVDINLTSGYSIVDSKNIANYFLNVKRGNILDDERNSLEIIGKNIQIQSDGKRYPKPSMETGFHALLDKYVIHTHSVWTNLINCNESSSAVLNQLEIILNKKIAFIPFVSPGFGLSCAIASVIKNSIKNNIGVPEIFFLENHGVIIHGISIEKVQNILFQIDHAIQELLEIRDTYPNTQLIEKGANYYPVDNFVNYIFEKYNIDLAFFNKVLFPDQTVFFNQQISFDSKVSKKINFINSSINYHSNEKESAAIHETMTAYLFIYDKLVELGFKHRFIIESEISYINNMEMEKHRKSIIS